MRTMQSEKHKSHTVQKQIVVQATSTKMLH